MEDLVVFEEELAKRMLEKGLSEAEAWRRVERVHMKLMREENQPHWRVKEQKEVAEAILKEKGWKAKYIGWHGDPDEWFHVDFEVIKEGEPLDDYDWSIEERGGKKIVSYYWWY